MVLDAFGFPPAISWIPSSFLKSNIDPALINQVLVIIKEGNKGEGGGGGVY